MFTGIIEEVGIVKKIKKNKKNLILEMHVSFLKEIQINQSIAHNGACLTVIELSSESYSVCVINETIKMTNMSLLKEGSLINIERCLAIGDRLDGHFVQGHIDSTVKCVRIQEENGSWRFTFQYLKKYAKYLTPKGSVTLNGVSLTIAKIHDSDNCFEVSIIPYTFDHTNFKLIKVGDSINVEFDIITKQITRLYKD